MISDEEKRREEEKRERHTSPAQRAKFLRQAIAFVDAQQPVPRNSKAGCLAAAAKRQAAEQSNSTPPTSPPTV